MIKKLLVACMACGLMAQGAVQLTRDGRPLADIVRAEDSHPAVRYAAEELSRWVREISGAELPVLSQAGKGEVEIRLEVNPQGFGDDLKALAGNDGFAVRRRGDVVHLVASCPKGVLNGVYRWIYKNTDVIWFRPNVEFGTVFTPSKTLVFQHDDYRDVPVYLLRGWQMIGPWNHVPSEEWQVRNGANWSALTSYDPKRVKYGTVFEYGGGHNLVGRYITEKKYYAKHPEYFPLVNGKRLKPSEFRESTQLCFTNPDMVKAFIQEVDVRVKANPDYQTYRIMIEDNYNLCECPECMKDIRLPNGKVVTAKDRNFRSTQFFLFLNQVARHMQKHYPGKRILTFGYFFTEIPPACHVEKNISISFCPIYKNSKEVMTGPSNKVWNRQFLGWMDIRADLTWREYFGLVPPFPRPTDCIAMADWQYANSFGINKTYSEMYADAVGPRMDGIKSWNMNAMYFWVMTNGFWNPYRDYRDLRQEFLIRTFGPAAQDVAEFYHLTEKGWFTSRGDSHWNDLAAANWRLAVNQKGNHEPCRQALTRALAKKVHPNARKMLQAMLETFEEQSSLGQPFSIKVERTDKPVPFDPEFTSIPWARAQVATGFKATNTNPAKERTEVRLLYDAANLYIGARCFDKEVGKVFARPAGQPRDQWPAGDKFEICISGGDQATYQFATDTNGNHFDARDKDTAWNPDLTCQIKKTKDGWSVLVTIPLKSIKVDLNKKQDLAIMFTRYLSHGKKSTEVTSWGGGSPISSGSYGQMVLMGTGKR